jgi:hypothetical protein
MRWTFIAALAAAAAWGCPTDAVAQKASIRSGPPCGSDRDLYLCGTISRNIDFYLNGAQFKFPAKGTVHVSWQGTVFCNVSDQDAGAAANSLIEYYLHLNLNEGQGLSVYNEPGSASVGERLNVSATTNDVTAARTLLAPVTLSKTFALTGGGRRTYRVWVKGDFRSVGPGSYCNVNGGVITAIYNP